MNLLALLSSSNSGLAAQQTVLAVDSNNIQNASNPNYAQQQANLATVPPDYVGGAFVGSGVQVASITQSRDVFVEAQMPASLSNASSSSAEAQALQGVSVLDPQAQGNLASAFANFYSAMQSLTQDAGSAQLRQAAVASAQALATSFQTTSQGIAAARSGLDQLVGGQVTEVNQLAAQVAQLNAQISSAQATGAQPNDLLDTRQAALDQLAQLVGATTVKDQSGAVTVMLGGGLALVAGNVAGSLTTAPDPSNGGLLALRLTLAGGTASAPLAASALGGSIGGEIRRARRGARDGRRAPRPARLRLRGLRQRRPVGGLRPRRRERPATVRRRRERVGRGVDHRRGRGRRGQPVGACRGLHRGRPPGRRHEPAGPRRHRATGAHRRPHRHERHRRHHEPVWRRQPAGPGGLDPGRGVAHADAAAAGLRVRRARSTSSSSTCRGRSGPTRPSPRSSRPRRTCSTRCCS